MALDEAIVFAVYEDDGASGPGSQDSSTFPQKALLIFSNMPAAKEFETGLRTFSSGRKNPRITAFYSQDADEILASCWPVKIVEPAKYPANKSLEPTIDPASKRKATGSAL